MQEGEAIWNKPRQEQLSEIRRACQLFYGITDATLSKDLAWRFSILGRLVERADKTSRILDVKYYLLLPSLDELGGVLDELNGSLFYVPLELIKCLGKQSKILLSLNQLQDSFYWIQFFRDQ